VEQFPEEDKVTQKAVRKENIKDVLKVLLDKYPVFAPVLEEGNLLFRALEEPDRAVLDRTMTRMSPKGIFFQQTERLFTHEKGNVTETLPDEGRTILFGVHPCDMRSFSLMDMVFDTESFNDNYYTKRRRQTVIFGMACVKPGDQCFCNWFGIEVGSPVGADVFIRDAGGKYLLETVTEQGEEILAEIPGLESSDQKDRDEAMRLETDAQSQLPGKVNVDSVKELLDRMFEDEFWDKLHRRCLACGICTYVCPTCHCFDIEDEMVDRLGERVRNWDSCMYPGFTLHGSGHNPRPTQKERWRQRVMHKFNYFKSNNDTFSCIGCGRCTMACPVSIDIREIVMNLDGLRSAK